MDVVLENKFISFDSILILMSMWVCREGSSGEYENYSVENNVICIGWQEIGDLSSVKNRESIKKLMAVTYPDKSLNSIANMAGQVYTFVNNITEGDTVLVPSKIYPGKIRICIVKGPYCYNGEYTHAPHSRPVEWSPRMITISELDMDLRHSLNSIMTVFSVNADNASRISKIIKSQPEKIEPSSEEEEIPADFDVSVAA